MPYVTLSRIPWMKGLGALIFALVCLQGCATHTLLIPSGVPVRLREPIHQVKVWVADKDGKEVEAVVDLPAGWYCLEDPGPK